MQLQVWRTVIDRDASATAEAGRQANATTAGDWSRQPGVRPAGARQAARACHYVRGEALRAAMDGDRRPRTTGRALSGQRVPAVCSAHTDNLRRQEFCCQWTSCVQQFTRGTAFK